MSGSLSLTPTTTRIVKVHGVKYRLIRMIIRIGVIILIFRIVAPEPTIEVFIGIKESIQSMISGAWDWTINCIVQKMWENGHMNQIPSTDPDIIRRMLENGYTGNHTGPGNALPEWAQKMLENGEIHQIPSTNPNWLQRMLENGNILNKQNGG